MKNIRKLDCILLILALFLLIFPFLNSDSETDIEVMKQAFTEEISTSGMKEKSEKELIRTLHTAPDQLNGWFWYGPGSAMDVTSLLVLRLQDHSQEEQLQAALETYRKEELKKFEGYGVEQTELLNNAVLIQKKGYIIYIVSSHAKKWETIFQETL